VASELVDRMKAAGPGAGDRARDEAYV